MTLEEMDREQSQSSLDVCYKAKWHKRPWFAFWSNRINFTYRPSVWFTFHRLIYRLHSD